MTESKIIKLKTSNASISIIKAGYSDGSHNLQMMLEDLSLYFTFQGARVVLTMSIWTEIGLCNGALETLVHFVYTNGQQPPCLPI